MNNRIGTAAIIFACAAFIAAVGAVTVNVLSLNWVKEIYRPFDRMIKKFEPHVDKLIASMDDFDV